MSTGIYTAMSGVEAQSRRVETLGNNLANAQTPGFKVQHTLFRQIHNDLMNLGDPRQAMGVERPVRVLPEDRLPVAFEGRFTQFETGPLINSGEELDLAIEGDGFLTVLGQGDQRYFTRNGALRVSNEGLLTTQAGLPVLSDEGEPINLASATSINIGSDGTVSADDNPVGKLGVVRFADPLQLERVGESLYQVPANPAAGAQAAVPEPVADPQIRQGFLEGANVNVVYTMTHLIEANRMFEFGTKALLAYKAMDETSTRDVGRLR